ncbi:CLUMA_CG016933, isoform A [Clunio marinus]|uniref:CLUMA_CG016933, isoform A n=1 Tax=Clunio marinus TaxID=568069 RepID=A0A1J1IVW1_9DIPT|nr:CLUMA_CG016933, isoform A [Clunio marinus]
MLNKATIKSSPFCFTFPKKLQNNYKRKNSGKVKSEEKVVRITAIVITEGDDCLPMNLSQQR